MISINNIIIDNVITVTNVIIVCYCPTLSEVTWLTGNGIVEAAPGEMDLLGRTRALHREQNNHKISLQFLRGEHSWRIVIDKLSHIFAVYQLEVHGPMEDLNF